jgi:predicted transcriptional regulator
MRAISPIAPSANDSGGSILLRIFTNHKYEDMTTFTSSLPQDLLDQLDQQAKALQLPKNKLIQRALELYLEHLERSAYVQSFKRAAKDHEAMQIAEEGMTSYLRQLEKE